VTILSTVVAAPSCDRSKVSLATAADASKSWTEVPEVGAKIFTDVPLLQVVLDFFDVDGLPITVCHARPRDCIRVLHGKTCAMRAGPCSYSAPAVTLRLCPSVACRWRQLPQTALGR
jgi:hypothetical protein